MDKILVVPQKNVLYNLSLITLVPYLVFLYTTAV